MFKIQEAYYNLKIKIGKEIMKKIKLPIMVKKYISLTPYNDLKSLSFQLRYHKEFVCEINAIMNYGLVKSIKELAKEVTDKINDFASKYHLINLNKQKG